MFEAIGVGHLVLGAILWLALNLVSLALVAVRHTVAGVAATLMALTPILVIPLVYLVRREKAGWGGLGGAAMAVCGAALLLL